MDRQLTVEARRDHFHLRFHNYFGPQEGHNFGELLGLAEVEPPSDDSEEYDHLKVGEYFMWHPMGYHPNLHALVPREKLTTVAELVRDYHVHILDGADLLPHLPPPEFVAPHGPQGEEINYIELIEKEHRPSWERGPRAMAGAFLLRAIPTVLLIGAVFIAGKHMGDHRVELAVDDLFHRAQQPGVEQGLLGRLLSPDHSREVRTTISAVRWAEGSAMILADGNYLQVDGVSDVLAMLRKAASTGKAPIFEADLVGGEVRVPKIVAGAEMLASNVRLRRLAKLPPSGNKPLRGENPGDGVYRELTNLLYSNTPLLEQLQNQRICLTGRLAAHGDGWMLRQSNGSSVALKVRPDNGAVLALFGVFADSGRELQVDMILESVYPWTDERGAQTSRRDTKVIGQGRVASASASNYHAAPI